MWQGHALVACTGHWSLMNCSWIVLFSHCTEVTISVGHCTEYRLAFVLHVEYLTETICALQVVVVDDGKMNEPREWLNRPNWSDGNWLATVPIDIVWLTDQWTRLSNDQWPIIFPSSSTLSPFRTSIRIVNCTGNITYRTGLHHNLPSFLKSFCEQEESARQTRWRWKWESKQTSRIWWNTVVDVVVVVCPGDSINTTKVKVVSHCIVQWYELHPNGEDSRMLCICVCKTSSSLAST